MNKCCPATEGTETATEQNHHNECHSATPIGCSSGTTSTHTKKRQQLQTEIGSNCKVKQPMPVASRIQHASIAWPWHVIRAHGQLNGLQSTPSKHLTAHASNLLGRQSSCTHSKLATDRFSMFKAETSHRSGHVGSGVVCRHKTQQWLNGNASLWRYKTD